MMKPARRPQANPHATNQPSSAVYIRRACIANESSRSNAPHSTAHAALALNNSSRQAHTTCKRPRGPARSHRSSNAATPARDRNAAQVFVEANTRRGADQARRGRGPGHLSSTRRGSHRRVLRGRLLYDRSLRRRVVGRRWISARGRRRLRAALSASGHERCALFTARRLPRGPAPRPRAGLLRFERGPGVQRRALLRRRRRQRLAGDVDAREPGAARRRPGARRHVPPAARAHASGRVRVHGRRVGEQRPFPQRR